MSTAGLIGSFASISVLLVWLIGRSADRMREDTRAMLDAEEEQIRQDIRAMRKWYTSRRIAVEAESDHQAWQKLMETE